MRASEERNLLHPPSYASYSCLRLTPMALVAASSSLVLSYTLNMERYLQNTGKLWSSIS